MASLIDRLSRALGWFAKILSATDLNVEAVEMWVSWGAGNVDRAIRRRARSTRVVGLFRALSTVDFHLEPCEDANERADQNRDLQPHW